MVKATLRTSSPKPATITSAPAGAQVVDNNPVVVEGVPVESITTACPGGGLENMIPLNEPKEETAAPAETSSAIATRPNMAVGHANQYEGGGLDGEWGADDLKFPQLKQVQGSGPLSTQFDNGTIIYGETELLPAPSVKPDAKNPVIRFFPVSLTKQFREKLSQEASDAGEMPRIANSLAEVEQMGGTTRWVGNERPDNYWEPSARCIFLLELPEGSEHPGFALTLDGKQYAVAVYYAAGGAFRSSAKIIFNTALTSLLVPILGEDGQPKRGPSGQVIKKPMLWKNVWTLAFAKVKAGNFTPWRPAVKLLPRDESGPEVRAYCESLVAGDAAEAE